MWRLRCLWPLHLVQAPHLSQSPHTQSTAPLGSGHGPASHVVVSFSAPEHPLPWPWTSVTTRRIRECWPAPHLLSQAPQTSQSPSTQSTFSITSTQPSAWTLQGAISFSGPLQNLPAPKPGESMRRFRSFQPSQEQLQPLHGVHWPNSQSTLTTEHDTPRLQGLVSCVVPSGGLPHSFAEVFTLRVRNVTPPMQVAEQSSHSDQDSHSPSMHALQGFVLHAPLSLLSRASHRFPNPSGATAM
mmetsp:Transcript_259/g.613  ORF Transcript_259/g.613 Transcript_259/m.613 type:complete len:242 (+) Transcript_259:521-1246(+)